MERRESEAQAQAAVFDWARWEQSQTPVLKAMYHAANEGKRSVRAGADLKRQGMKPGVSDICLPYAAEAIETDSGYVITHKGVKGNGDKKRAESTGNMHRSQA